MVDIVELGSGPTDGELAAIAMARAQMPTLIHRTAPALLLVSDAAIWRVLHAPGIPLYRARSRIFDVIDAPIAFPGTVLKHDEIVGIAGSRLELALVGLDVLGLKAARPEPNSSTWPDSRISISRQISALGREARRAWELAYGMEAAKDLVDRERYGRRRSDLISRQLELHSRASLRSDPTGGPKERFIRNHLGAVYAEIYRRKAGISHVGAEKERVDGPFIRFCCQFAAEVGLDKFKPGTVAAALKLKKTARRKKLGRELPGDSRWVEKYLPKIQSTDVDEPTSGPFVQNCPTRPRDVNHDDAE